MARNPSQDKKLSAREIRLLKRHGIDPEELKEYNAGLDLFKDGTGKVYVKAKDGSGEGDPTDVNIKDLK